MSLPGILQCAVALVLTVAPITYASAQDVMTEWDHIKPLAPPALKAVSIDSAKTALVMMDFDKKSCVPAKRARCAEALPKISALLKQARDKHMLVVHFYNANMSQDDIVPALAPVGNETAQKMSGDKFYGTDLAKVFKEHGVDTVILAGTSANGAVLATAMGAFEQKMKAIVPIDVMPADNIWQEQFTIWEIANGPGFREVSTMTRTDMLKF
jgi:nicotinamidase-related amidase